MGGGEILGPGLFGFGLGGEVDELDIGTQYPAVAGEFHAVVELELIAAAGATEEHISCTFGQGSGQVYARPHDDARGGGLCPIRRILSGGLGEEGGVLFFEFLHAFGQAGFHGFKLTVRFGEKQFEFLQCIGVYGCAVGGGHGLDAGGADAGIDDVHLFHASVQGFHG